MSTKDLSDLIHTLALEQGPKRHGLSLLDFSEAYLRLAGPMATNPSGEALEERKKFLIDLQAHLRGKFKTIMEAVSSGETRAIFMDHGMRTITADPQTGQFKEEFIEDEKPGDPLAIEKKYFEDRLICLIRDLGLQPWRLKKCKKCDSIFYNFSYRERKYCSPSCASAVRQADFRKRKQEK